MNYIYFETHRNKVHENTRTIKNAMGIVNRPETNERGIRGKTYITTHGEDDLIIHQLIIDLTKYTFGIVNTILIDKHIIKALEIIKKQS